MSEVVVAAVSVPASGQGASGCHQPVFPQPAWMHPPKEAQPKRAYIGLGSNIGDKSAMIAEALERLAAVDGIHIAARSRDHRTAPWGDQNQDWFINACAAIDTTLSPHGLLDVCLATEHDIGRVRTRRWGPRVIDIDVLDYDGISMRSDRLLLPHPLLLERAFVMIPLAEIAGDRHVAGQKVSDVAGRFNGADVTPLEHIAG